MNNFREIIALIQDNHLEIGIGIKHGYRDIVQRHKNRYEMPHKMDTAEFEIILHNNTIMQTVKRILGEDAVIINKSLLVSVPGAEVSICLFEYLLYA